MTKLEVIFNSTFTLKFVDNEPYILRMALLTEDKYLIKKYPPSRIKDILFIKSASCLSPYPRVCKVKGIFCLP